MTLKIPKAFIFDLDGTLYLGENILPGAVDALKWARERGAKVRFVTNNPRSSRNFYTNKLNRLGISANINEVVTSAQLTAKYLQNSPEYGKLFVIGEEQLRKELLEVGMQLVKTTHPDTVVVSFDTTLTYEKLLFAYRSIKKGARFIATNPDPVCPTPGGGLVDAGAIIAALEASSGRNVEKVIGKPSELLAELLVEDLKVPAAECAVVGDRLNTDIRLGKQAGMTTVWIRDFHEKVPNNIEYHPDFILESVSELHQTFSNSEGEKSGRTI